MRRQHGDAGCVYCACACRTMAANTSVSSALRRRGLIAAPLTETNALFGFKNCALADAGAGLYGQDPQPASKPIVQPLLVSETLRHSCRRAFIGSTREARLAGT